MPPAHRGQAKNHRGRGRGGGPFKNPNSRQTPQEMAVMRRMNVKDRLGSIPTYGKIPTSKRYRTSSSVAGIPQEDEVRETAKNFIKTYYNIFDSEGRTNLGSLYSAEAFFSYSATHPLPAKGRNLLEVRETNERLGLLLHDRTNIAQSLSLFPRTEHPVNQLSCDVPFYIVNPMFIASMQIIVTGVYKDLTPGQVNPLVAFTRVFVIKHVSVDRDGKPVYEIFNDLFLLQPPTPGQIKNYHNNAQLANRASGNQQQRQNISAEDASSKLKEEMIRSIMSKTKMNKAGTLRLLEDTNWTEQAALDTFRTLFEANQIPQELFT